MVSLEEIRRERINMIIKAMNKNKNQDKEKLIAKCCLEWGTARRTILEYIKMIELANV